MKIFNLSLKELLKNKLYFSYFALGLALLLAVVCVLANYSEQVFDGFFTQFNGGHVLSLEMKELPRESRYYDELPIFAKGSGITCNIMLSNGEKSVYLPSYKSGMCVISEGKGFIPKAFLPLTFLGGSINFDKETIFLSEALADELGCEKGGAVSIDGAEYTVGQIMPSLSDSCSFITYDPEITAEEFTVIISNKEQLLDVTEHLNPGNFNDTEGILALCEGYRAMKTAMNIVLLLLMAVCAVYIFAFIKMYLSKRMDFLRILFNLGIRKSAFFSCIGSVFIFLCFAAGALGFVLAVLLDRLVDKWAQELMGMYVDRVNYLAYFAVGFLICAVISAISLLINSRGISSISEVKSE